MALPGISSSNQSLGISNTPTTQNVSTGISSSNQNSGQPYTNPILSTNTADTHLNTVVKPAVAQVNQDMSNQALTVAQNKAAADAVAAQKAQTDAATKTAADQAATAKQVADAKTAAVNAAQTGSQNQSKVGTVPALQVTSAVPYGGGQTGVNNWQQVTYGDGTTKVATKNSDGTFTPVAQADIDLQNTKDALTQTNADYQAKALAVTKTIDDIRSGVIPLSAGEQAQVTGLQKQFEQLINQQTLQNQSAIGQANIRGYQKGSAEYDPMFQVNTIGAIVSAGANKVSDLMIKEASAVASLTDTLKNNDIANIKSAWDIYQTATKDRQTALQKTIDDASKAVKDAADAKQKVTDAINTVAETAAKNGADAATLKAITTATSESGAINAAGSYLQTATGDLGDYLQYKRDTQAKGLTPMDYIDFKNKQTYKDAYAKKKAETDASSTTDTATTTGNIVQGGITQATGLSLAAFNYLTQGTSSMSRMSAADRKNIMEEANNYLNKTGTDVSTFQSQYKAYNDVLQKNIARANQTAIMAGEVAGSADSLISAIDQKDMGNIKSANILNLLIGKETNDPTTQKYSSQLRFMANDLAGYLAAARGATSPELQDQKDAADIISNGMSTRSVQAFKDSIVANEEKVAGVVNSAVNNAQKQVWGLFGAADKFVPKAVPLDDNAAKTKIENFTSSPSAKNTIPTDINTKISSMTGGKTFKDAGELAIYMAGLPGATPSSVYTALTNLGIIK